MAFFHHIYFYSVRCSFRIVMFFSPPFPPKSKTENSACVVHFMFIHRQSQYLFVNLIFPCISYNIIHTFGSPILLLNTNHNAVRCCCSDIVIVFLDNFQKKSHRRILFTANTIPYCLAKTNQTQWFIILSIWERESIKSTKIENKTQNCLLRLGRERYVSTKRRRSKFIIFSVVSFRFHSIRCLWLSKCAIRMSFLVLEKSAMTEIVLYLQIQSPCNFLIILFDVEQFTICDKKNQNQFKAK